jgi:hypothetical protein
VTAEAGTLGAENVFVFETPEPLNFCVDAGATLGGAVAVRDVPELLKVFGVPCAAGGGDVLTGATAGAGRGAGGGVERVGGGE